MSKILKSIKSTICSASSNTLCCPIYLGSVQLKQTRSGGEQSLSPVYALNSTSIRILEFPIQGEMDMIRLEPYYWKDKLCIPNKEFLVEDEGSSQEYKPHLSFLDLNLPPSITVSTLRCLAIWKKEEMLGYAHLYSPLIPAGEVQLDQNTIQKQETQE